MIIRELPPTTTVSYRYVIEHYSKSTDEWFEMRDWIKEQDINCSVGCKKSYFWCEEDAVFFMLRWG